ncbi:hypothetical protein CDL15_Pgr011053 [Punica granatum]|uniref:1-phosphatidylinositol-3-phosphate 5-kinase n=1 Tax=Punica granatum TaxID=22663 RepID=A0A218XNI6_PUNGR|nr:hypothetical protein CDL15_Pgr011053 [Punica granatum]
MRIGDSILLDLIDKLRYWIPWDTASSSSNMPGDTNIGCKMCCDSDANVKDRIPRYYCLGCGRFLCAKCVGGFESLTVLGSVKEDGRVGIKVCKFCARTDHRKKNSEKVHPRDSPEPPSPYFSCSEKVGGSINNIGLIQRDRLEPFEHVYSPHGSSVTDFSARPSPVSVRCSPSRCRSDEEEADGSGKYFCSPLSESCHGISDIDTRSLSFRHDFYSFKSAGSTPSGSPSRNHFTLNRGGHFVQHEQEGSPLSRDDGPFSQEETTAVLRRPGAGTEDTESTDYCSDELSIFRSQYERFQKPLDFENNDLIWFPPLPNDEKDEMEGNYFYYDDEDDYVGDSGAVFTPSSSLSCIFSAKERHNEGNKEPLRAQVQSHFRALVSQLLYGEGIGIGQENGPEKWVDIVMNLAWQAANFVKPDTSRGGSMDPCDYVKVKCVASGSPNESALVKGIVCTKNVKHKRMTSQYKNPRVLILGGALEYQRVPNQLASFDTLLQQEIDHLKKIISKIEALHPNVLLVEKSVSSYAQEYLLAKEISLVLNVKRPLLERISRCTGAPITPSTDSIPTTRLGHCELFKLERVSEEYEVLLRGSCRDELKKVKHVVQYAVFAAYHLSLETSFLADEGATLPNMPLNPSTSSLEKTASDNRSSIVSTSASQRTPEVGSDNYSHEEGYMTDSELMDPTVANLVSDTYDGDVVLTDVLDSKDSDVLPSSDTQIPSHPELIETMGRDGKNEVSGEYFSSTDTNQSILVSFSSRCVLKRIVCERSRLLRIKFYGCFDKPLGRYLRDDLFDQASIDTVPGLTCHVKLELGYQNDQLTSYCRSCEEPAEAHVLCYTHQQGNLTVNVKRIHSLRLPGEQDGKIWMWHRCLKCAHDANGVPPATRRVVMSDAAWGLSFGKFLELSFSNHATANRIATCGHSLQRDCLRYYGFGSMVAFFRYSPIDILSVCLPPSMLEFNSQVQQKWLKKEAGELIDKMETLYLEISGLLDGVEQKSAIFGNEFVVTHELQNYILELKDLLKKERADYNDLLEAALACSSQLGQSVDILELNHLQRSLVIGSLVWDRRLYSLHLLLGTNSPKAKRSAALCTELKELSISPESNVSEPSNLVASSVSGSQLDTKEEDLHSDGETLSETITSSDEPNLSERIDSAWTGSDHMSDSLTSGSLGPTGGNDSPSFRRLMAPMRVNSFDSALKIRERIQKGFPPSSLHLSTIRSFHASGDYRNMVKDPVSSMMRTYSQMLPRDAQKITPSIISSAAHLALGARLLVPHTGNDIVIAVYDDEPTSIISYALSSKEHEDWVSIKTDEHGNDWNGTEGSRDDASAASSFSSLHSFGALDVDHINGYGNYTSEDATSSSVSSLFRDPKRSPHLRISFGDESPSSGGKVKFSVTCYFGKQFESLRRKCCPSELDFVRSLSRCRRWSAQGGKSNVYFAKSMDERFIIKQVTKTELDSFEDFASEYFKYLNDSLSSGSPTCLAKILGLYQVTVKHLRGGKEMKMDLMVMENLFFRRSISRVYDLKGSNRARYNPDTTGKDKVQLDMNLLETLRTQPIFLGSKAKRSLERAIWNDTSFLASVDVMDYSLLVGVDDESKELVLGIIDFMRQYTWDKHLETWVKASGILGGPKNASPTIISPKQYKKRFRKAMTAYFLTVPDQWSS